MSHATHWSHYTLCLVRWCSSAFSKENQIFPAKIKNRPFPEPNRNRRVGTGSLVPVPVRVGTGNTGTVYQHTHQVAICQKEKGVLIFMFFLLMYWFIGTGTGTGTAVPGCFSTVEPAPTKPGTHNHLNHLKALPMRFKNYPKLILLGEPFLRKAPINFYVL